MKTIGCLEDLAPFGIEPLTGEPCGLMLRVLFDITDKGQKIIEKCLGLKIVPAEPWTGRNEEHIGSIMLARDMMIPIGIFALLESGCTEVLQTGQCLYGIEADDESNRRYILKRFENVRRYAYEGTAGGPQSAARHRQGGIGRCPFTSKGALCCCDGSARLGAFGLAFPTTHITLSDSPPFRFSLP